VRQNGLSEFVALKDNPHMMTIDKNNLAVADAIVKWLGEHLPW
jgi:hypothetical protein